MKKTTRFLAIVLAVILALSCFSAAFADFNFHFGDVGLGIGNGTYTFPTGDLFTKLQTKINKILAPSALENFMAGMHNGMDGDNPLNSLGNIIGSVLKKALDMVDGFINPKIPVIPFP